MFTVALIGADGSGKTTISNLLLESFPLPMKYIYMGTAIQSSNITLPTTRLILYLKLRAHQKTVKKADKISSFHEYNEHNKIKRGKIKATISLLNRLSEEWYRQLVSFVFRMRGYIVLFDRHFIFEYAVQAEELKKTNMELSERIHLWLLYHFYPKPDLVIFLDAPAELLIKRKNEWPIERLKAHQEAVCKLGESMPNFIRIDATQTVEKVYADVCESILPHKKTKDT